MCRLKAQFFSSMDQAVLKIQNAFANSQPCAQFVAVERLGEVVIGAGVEPTDNVLAIIFAGDQQNVLITRALLAANSAAQFRPINFRHDPVQNQQLRRLLLLQNVPGASAVFGDQDFVPPILKPTLQNPAKHGIVFCYQDAKTRGRLLKRRFERDCRLSRWSQFAPDGWTRDRLEVFPAKADRIVTRRMSTSFSSNVCTLAARSKSPFRPASSSSPTLCEAWRTPKQASSPFRVWAMRSVAALSSWTNASWSSVICFGASCKKIWIISRNRSASPPNRSSAPAASHEFPLAGTRASRQV